MFVLHASEIAALVGLNPYKNKEEAIRDAYNRNKPGLAPEAKRKAQDICNQDKDVAAAFATVTKSAGETSTTADVASVKEKFTSDISKIKNKKLSEISNSYETNMKKIEDEFSTRMDSARTRSAKKLVSDEKSTAEALLSIGRKKTELEVASKMDHVVSQATSTSNTQFGTRKEDTVADMYKAHTGRGIHKPPKTYYLDVIPGSVKICGKFDGFNDDDVLIEIKNRMRRLFGRVVDYEKVQIHVYMAMAQTERSQLVERYQDKIMIHQVEFDGEFMDNILSQLKDISGQYFKNG